MTQVRVTVSFRLRWAVICHGFYYPIVDFIWDVVRGYNALLLYGLSLDHSLLRAPAVVYVHYSSQEDKV